MRKLLLTICSVFLLAACGNDNRGPDPTGHQSETEAEDYCERFGWYGDGHCDEVCANPDPDCSTTSPDPSPGPGPSNNLPTPDPEPPTPSPIPHCEDAEEPVGTYYYVGVPGECDDIDYACEDGFVPFENECGCGCEQVPNTGLSCDHIFSQGEVEFVSEDPQACAAIRFACLDDQIQFIDDQCGCGCIDPWQTGLACLDDSKPSVERVGDPLECQLIDFICEEAWTYFSDDCGCGCRLVCSDDFECPNGYCELRVDDDPFCVYPNCDDGTEVLCDAEPPECYDTDVVAVQNGCWACLDARTCGPSMGP